MTSTLYEKRINTIPCKDLKNIQWAIRSLQLISPRKSYQRNSAQPHPRKFLTLPCLLLMLNQNWISSKKFRKIVNIVAAKAFSSVAGSSKRPRHNLRLFLRDRCKEAKVSNLRALTAFWTVSSKVTLILDFKVFTKHRHVYLVPTNQFHPYGKSHLRRKRKGPIAGSLYTKIKRSYHTVLTR